MKQNIDRVGIMGRKLGMTQAFDEAGHLVGLTVLSCEPGMVVRCKTSNQEGYEAIQVGFVEVPAHKLNKPNVGHFKKHLKGKVFYKELCEFRVSSSTSYQVGQALTVDAFKPGQRVDIIGRSKGKGFQGTVKRHKFTRGPETHGSKNVRPPGSIGSSAFPSRVLKGKRMPGHMGNRNVTIIGLRIHAVDPEKHLIFVEGAVPGARNNLVTIRPSTRA